jgi:hypothetical protein
MILSVQIEYVSSKRRSPIGGAQTSRTIAGPCGGISHMDTAGNLVFGSVMSAIRATRAGIFGLSTKWGQIKGGSEMRLDFRRRFKPLTI